MQRLRSVYIVDLVKVLSTLGTERLVQRCADCKFSSVWIRVGRGKTRDPNLGHPDLGLLRTLCAGRGIELWGWHVPFCKTAADAALEASLAADWIAETGLLRLVVDAERTDHPPRFQGGAQEAQIYLDHLAARMPGKISFSSHDRPSLHADLPFSVFLQAIPGVLPQVYYRHGNVDRRLSESIADYRAAGLGDDITVRYEPTGNISSRGDLPVGTPSQCVDATKEFIDKVKTLGLAGYSFWCWDDAPDEVWPALASIPV